MEADLQGALLRYCQSRLPYRHPTISNFTRISDGWECEVFSFALEDGEGGVRAREDLILRVYPGDDALQKSAREFNAMKQLHSVGFPVPKVFVLESSGSPLGNPFVIMEKINGRTLGPVIGRSPIAKKRELIRQFCKMFVDLHALDWRPFVPGTSPYEASGLIDRWLSRVQQYLNQLQMSEFGPVLGWLRERSADVGPARISVTHGDYHAVNVLLRDDGAAFVIDWTQAEVSDFRFDLGWTLLLMGMYNGWAMREAILGEYERIAGFKVEHIEYFEVAACVRRLFVIVVSLTGRAETLGLRPGADAQISANVGHIEGVYALLCYRTGMTIPQIETLLSTLRASGKPPPADRGQAGPGSQNR